MPRNPCPHCTDYFISERLLQTHIHFIHNGGASQPTRPHPLVWAPRVGDEGAGAASDALLSPSTTSRRADEQRESVGNAWSSSVAMEVRGDDGDDGDSTRGMRPATRSGVGWSMQPGLSVEKPRHKPRTDRGSLTLLQPSPSFDVSTIPTSAPRSRPTTPSMSSMAGSFTASPGSRQKRRTDRLVAATTARQQRRSAGPERLAAPIAPPVMKFVVVYESQEKGVQQWLELPTTTPWTTFTALLESASAPIAGAYVPGRTTGFILKDGSWWFALVDHEGTREDRWRVLTSNLFYQAMISELMTHQSVWRHALVWHVRPTSPKRNNRVKQHTDDDTQDKQMPSSN